MKKRKQPPLVTWTTPPIAILPQDSPQEQSVNEHAPVAVAAIVAACGVSCNPVNVSFGPSTVVYHFNLVNLRDHSKLPRLMPAISARLRIQSVLSDSAIADFAISVARNCRDPVSLKQTLLSTPVFWSPTAAVLGVSSDNRPVAIDVADMPHLLIAGATGSGKTVALHTVITSMLFHGTPLHLRFVMIDPKRIELAIYGSLPHLLTPIVTDVSAAIYTLNELCRIMDERYYHMQQGYTQFPRIVVVVDELADLMLTSKKQVETAIVRLAQMGRAAGIHLLLATQRPTVNVVTGLIKANIPARLALTMASYRDANVLEVKGADKLAGKGDALFQGPNHTVPPIRLQTAYTSAYDIATVVGWWGSPQAHMPL